MPVGGSSSSSARATLSALPCAAPDEASVPSDVRRCRFFPVGRVVEVVVVVEEEEEDAPPLVRLAPPLRPLEDELDDDDPDADAEGGVGRAAGGGARTLWAALLRSFLMSDWFGI